MEWLELGIGTVQGGEIFWSLPPKEGGQLWLRLPPDLQGQSVFLGVGDAYVSPPDRISSEIVRLEPFATILKFDIPDCLERPFVGVRFFDGIDSSFSLSYRLMAFKLPAINEGLSTFQEIPATAGYSLGDSFIFSQTGEILTLISQPFGDDNIWAGPEKLDRVEFTPTVVADPDTTKADAVPAEDQLRWSPFTGGESFFVSCFVSLFTGDPQSMIALVANTNEDSDFQTFPPGLATTEPKKLALTSMAGSVLGEVLSISAVSDLPVTLGVEIRFRKIYRQAT